MCVHSYHFPWPGTCRMHQICVLGSSFLSAYQQSDELPIISSTVTQRYFLMLILGWPHARLYFVLVLLLKW